MFAFEHIVRYWRTAGIPIMQVFQTDHALFTEESGEIALSVLAHAQPSNTKADLEVTRNYWQLVKSRYTALRSDDELPRSKKHRAIGMLSLS